MQTKPVLYTEEGERVLPVKWEICSCCKGHGKSSSYLGSYTSDEIADAGEDFMEDYMAGNFDRPCDACRGSGKLEVVDWSRMTPADQRAYRIQEQEYIDMRREERMERMCGA